MKRFSVFMGLLWMFSAAHAQFYYQDIYSLRQTVRDHDLYRENHVSRLELISQDPNGAVNDDFRCEKTFSNDYREVSTVTGSFQTGASVLNTFFNEAGKVIRSVDSSAVSANTTVYEYDSGGHLVHVVFSSRSGKIMDAGYAEEHIYKYDARGFPVQMIRQKGGKPYSTVTFKTDEKGRVTEERERRGDITSPAVYYKFNDDDQLTDVYRYNAARQKMLPDYQFEYDTQGRLSEMLVVTAGGGDYNRWKYHYDEKGLITREECYGKRNLLKGIVLFHYKF